MQNKKSELSIIIPLYNASKYIFKLVTNIENLNQDVNIEIILVDDNSVDNTELIANNIIEKFKNIKYYRNKTNLGIAKTRNVGVLQSKSKYITFVDQDDELIDGYKKYITKLEISKSDFLYTNYNKKYRNKNIYYEFNDIDRLIDGDDINELKKYIVSDGGLTKSKHKIGRSVWNCIFRKKFIVDNNIQFFNIVDYEDDFCFVVECLKKAKKIYGSSNCYYCWNQQINSESHKKRYINNLYDKRKKYENYIIELIKNLDIEKNAYNDFIASLNLNTILYCFLYMVWNKNIFEYRNEIKDVIQNYTKKDLKRFMCIASRISDKAIVFLLKNKLFISAAIIEKTYSKIKNLIILNSI